MMLQKQPRTSNAKKSPTQNRQRQTKDMISCLLRHLAWKQSGLIL